MPLPYDPKFGDDKPCRCGHTYEKHFDSHEEMAPVGCKYCQCTAFVARGGKLTHDQCLQLIREAGYPVDTDRTAMRVAFEAAREMAQWTYKETGPGRETIDAFYAKHKDAMQKNHRKIVAAHLLRKSSDYRWYIGRYVDQYGGPETLKDLSRDCGEGVNLLSTCARVWRRFGEIYLEYPQLLWHHFAGVVDHPDQTLVLDSLDWAVANEATPNEMRAWRRAMDGEDLTPTPENPDAT